ncbi:MAG TPA: PDZ domain-containing protein [Methylomirabilota bacterium]|jgi:serine protease Do|nr:PDZ domain-containing protein [Methylomirabilota bacterium]
MMRVAVAALLLVMALLSEVSGAATRWGWLGVRIRDLSEQEMDDISQKHGLREGFGALIVEVIKETPADVAGIKTGDLVVAFKERPVVDTRALQRYVAAAGVGETVTITVLRREQGRRPVQVRIGPMPEAVAAERVAATYGFLLREPEAQPELGGARPPVSAPTVAAVLPKSRAEAAGLQIGDVLVELNGRRVTTLEDVRDSLLGLGEHSPLALIVRRDRERLSFLLAEPSLKP